MISFLETSAKTKFALLSHISWREFPWGPRLSFIHSYSYDLRAVLVILLLRLLESIGYMLHNSRGVFFLMSPKRCRQPPHSTLLGDPQVRPPVAHILTRISMGTSAVLYSQIFIWFETCFDNSSCKIVEIHGIYAPKFQGRNFSDVAEALHAATTQHPSGRPSSQRNDLRCRKHIPKYTTTMLRNSRGMFYLRPPKRGSPVASCWEMPNRQTEVKQ